VMVCAAAGDAARHSASALDARDRFMALERTALGGSDCARLEVSARLSYARRA
jgi:hypothetical protein